ncbi:UNVERIFIED_CONTAM: hypothetical protein GTU68_065450 [Idotea baltica]|nr:hypothetical protein [Idotea baltica]
MSRTALVTGGSRGIGAAISKALKAEGYRVAATYAGNDEAAASFTEETGIKNKWNVPITNPSKAGFAQVEADLGPIDSWCQRGITRDAPFHQCRQNSGNSHRHQPDRRLHTVHRLAGHARRRNLPRHRDQFGQSPEGSIAQVNYAATKTCDIGIIAVGTRGRTRWQSPPTPSAPLHRHRLFHGGSGKNATREHHRPDPRRSPWRAGRDCALCCVPGLR